MRACFIVGTLARGGAEKQLLFMLKALQTLGTTADVLCLTKGESYEDEIASAGVNVIHVGKATNRISRLWNIIGAIRETRPDIVQSSHFYTSIYAGAAGRFLGIPSIGAVRSDLSYELDSHKFTGSWQLHLPKLLITNSDIARQRLIQRGVDSNKIEFVRNVVEVESARDHNGSHHGLKILFVGRLDENKRADRFVRLASVLTERFPHHGLQFEIAGEGEERKRLESTADLLNLAPDRLRFLGDCRQINDIYSGADILVATSDREGTPNVVLEAMAHGLPVVATAVGGTKDIIDGKRGFLVEPGDEGALVKATTELISDKGLRGRLGAEGRRYVSENHSLKSLQAHLNKIYERLVSASRTRGKYSGAKNQQEPYEA